MLRLLREPLVQFLGIGVLIFALYAAFAPDTPAPTDETTITIDLPTVERLAEQYRTVWRRDPTAEELDGLINAAIREEILVRQALGLSMDQNDAVIRQRLAQKMQFLLESASGAEAIDEAALVAFYQENADRYEQPARVAFEQVFLGETPDEAVIAEALSTLRAGNSPETPRTLLPPSMPLSQEAQVDGLFGRDVFAAVNELPLNQWAGPVQSGFGTHLILVTEKLDPTLPPLDDIRERVETEWRAARSVEMANQAYDQIAAQYTIIRPDAAAVAGVTQ
ncbi:MAG: peptidyl-prolyl cis-trans isomerase [Rhodobacteraceae bacterium]|nr:peptidyl-prolyl cis-trans isomerase [Paracoccaceae bacterium]